MTNLPNPDFQVEVICTECLEVVAKATCEIPMARSIPCPFKHNGKCTLVKQDCGCGKPG